MKFKAALLASLLTVATSGVASAQFFGAPGDGAVPRSRVEQMQGLYASIQGGANWLMPTDVDQFDCGVGGVYRHKIGWEAGGAVGYAFGIGPRIEFEGTYRRNKPDTLNFDCGGVIPAKDGHVSQLALMANIAYDVYTGTRIVPYLGFGGGAVRTSVRNLGPGTFDPGDFVDDAAWTWGAQGFFGVDYLLTQALRVGIKYTFLHTPKIWNLKTSLLDCFCGSHESSMDPNNHSVMVAAMYNFGAPRVIPAPPPSPVAAPPPLQRNFLVFFDFDKFDITPEADRVIVQAANNAKTAAVTRITLTGHTDRAGPVAYNQRLSERRADAVKARLIREGVPAGAIVTIGRGESQPLVPTADGVREPQNRRVEIVL